jgi:hypothetical protein
VSTRTPDGGASTHSRVFRLLTSFFAVVALTLGVALLPVMSSSATSRGPSPSLGGVREVAHASGNTDFDGNWTVTDPVNGDTATLLSH